MYWATLIITSLEFVTYGINYYRKFAGCRFRGEYIKSRPILCFINYEGFGIYQ